MKPGVVAFGVLAATVALVGVLWVATSGDVKVSTDPEKAAPPQPANAGPPIPAKGPYAKAVPVEKEFKFGVMGLGESRSHTFVVENKGEAPLTLEKGQTTCKCTMSELKDGKIPPGGKAEIVLTWEAKERAPIFRQSATIRSDDPDNKVFDLTVSGEVIEAIIVSPPGDWQLGEIAEDKPATHSGQVVSRLHENFKIVAVETDSSHIKAKTEPLNADELKERSVKSGYRLEVEVAPGITVGQFGGKVTLKVEVPGKEGRPPVTSDVVVHVHGSRLGPIQILPTGGLEWHPEIMALNLGSYPAAVGKKVKLLMFVGGLGEESLEITKVENDTPFLKVSVVRDTKFASKTKQKYDLVFESEPGGPVATKVRKDSARIKLHTNHPKASELAFRVELLAE